MASTGMAHDHLHHGQGHEEKNGRRLAVVLGLSAVYMVAEAVGGWLTNSLALLADAGHMMSDVAALALSMFAIWFARRPPTPRKVIRLLPRGGPRGVSECRSADRDLHPHLRGGRTPLPPTA